MKDELLVATHGAGVCIDLLFRFRVTVFQHLKVSLGSACSENCVICIGFSLNINGQVSSL